MADSTETEYLTPTGQVLDYVIFRDVKDGKHYKLYFEARKMHVDEVTSQEEIQESVKYIKFIDMNDKRDAILYSKEGKIRMEKI